MEAIFLLKINFALYCVVFAVCLTKNRNFNIALVGLTYLAPLVPLGMTDANIERFLLVSCINFIFGIIEMVISVLTERPEDTTFDKPYFQQLFGHVLPICMALVGMSFVARATGIAVGLGEGMVIAVSGAPAAVVQIDGAMELRAPVTRAGTEVEVEVRW